MSYPRYSQKTKVNFDNAAKRVIAPYLKIVRKGERPPEEEENENFSYYLEKKPSVLLRDLSSFLSDSVDLPSVLNETCETLKTVTKASGVSLYMIDSVSNEIYLSQKPKTENEGYKISWKIKEGTIVAAYVANSREYVMLNDITGDPRFPQGIGYLNEMVTSVLCVPVVTPDGDCFAVIELFKEIHDENVFGKDDLKIVIVVTGWMGAAIHQNQQRIALKKQRELNDYLLDLTKCYFADTAMMEKMISEIVKFAKITLGAERGSFFIIDRDSEELVADLFDEGLESESGMHKKSIKVKFGREKGIASLVARTGMAINVKDAYNDPRFNKEIDQRTGYITRSILCMPIMGIDGILGVVQVVNKLNGGSFNSTDENLFRTFSVYCALALRYTQVHTQMQRTTYMNKIYEKLLQEQIKPCEHDIKNFIENPNTVLPQNFDTFSYYITPDVTSVMPQLCLHMLLEVVGDAVVNIERSMRYILEVRKVYRDNPYHNFEHAFCVCHCMYNILKINPKIFNKYEIQGLIIAALCHDADHPGFTNNFLQVVKDDLSKLYDESILENHHIFVTMQILDNCNIFEDITPEDYVLVTKEIKEAILATDLISHFKTRAKLNRMCTDGSFSWSNPVHRSLVKSIMITTCDLSGQCKPFMTARKCAEYLYKEFYNQGDIEKSMSLVPLSIMDREKQQTIPEDQIQFLAVVVIPCVDLLRLVLPNTEDLFNEAANLRNSWQEIVEMRGKKVWRKEDSLPQN